MNVLVFMLCCFLTEDTFISFICVCVCVCVLHKEHESSAT